MQDGDGLVDWYLRAGVDGTQKRSGERSLKVTEDQQGTFSRGFPATPGISYHLPFPVKAARENADGEAVAALQFMDQEGQRVGCTPIKAIPSSTERPVELAETAPEGTLYLRLMLCQGSGEALLWCDDMEIREKMNVILLRQRSMVSTRRKESQEDCPRCRDPLANRVGSEYNLG